MKQPIDYAVYYLDAKKKLTEVHDLLNKKHYLEASSLIDEIVVELRMMRAAIKTHIE